MEESSTKVWHHTPSSEVLRLLGVERLVQIKSLQVDESALTGESVPVHKHTDALALDTVLADRRNLAFAGTLVTAGQGEAVVSATGDRTETGNIARLIASAVELSTPQTKKIAQFSGLVLSVILGLAATTFVVGVVRGEKAVEMFMAAVALAVGAIPGGGARRRDGGAGHWRVAHGKKKSHYPQTPRRRNARQHDGYLFGIRVIMATGDNAKIAAVVAKQLNIDEVRAGVEPKDKRELVLALKAKGESAAMAGDGVNDAPALAEADVGIAMGTGTDVAIESAGPTLMKGDLQALVRAVHLSRATMKNIRQNLFCAFFYNALGVPVAAGLLYPFFGLLLNPMLAGAAMSLSSVSVILNALRLSKTRL